MCIRDRSSTEAERKRAARLQNKALSAPRTNGGLLSDIRPPEIEIELQKEIEIKREIEKVRPETGHPSHKMCIRDRRFPAKPGFCRCGCGERSTAAEPPTKLPSCFAAVSYTHLDVYKRQIHNCHIRNCFRKGSISF